MKNTPGKHNNQGTHHDAGGYESVYGTNQPSKFAGSALTHKKPSLTDRI